MISIPVEHHNFTISLNSLRADACNKLMVSLLVNLWECKSSDSVIHRMAAAFDLQPQDVISSQAGGWILRFGSRANEPSRSVSTWVSALNF